MTIFSDNPHDRRIERFMTAIPNFKPRGVGVRFSESQVLITITAATPTEILGNTHGNTCGNHEADTLPAFPQEIQRIYRKRGKPHDIYK